MPIFNLEEFKVALAKSEAAIRVDFAERYDPQRWHTYARMMERAKIHVHPYNFNQDEIECHWYYELNLLNSVATIPKQASLCQYVIGFTAPEEQRKPYIVLNSLFYSIYDDMNVLYEKFELVPDNYAGWFDAYLRYVIFKNQDMDKLIKFVNDEHVKAKVTDIFYKNFYKNVFEMAMAVQWVEGTAYMLRFMKDHDIYEEREEIRL